MVRPNLRVPVAGDVQCVDEDGVPKLGHHVAASGGAFWAQHQRRIRHQQQVYGVYCGVDKQGEDCARVTAGQNIGGEGLPAEKGALMLEEPETYGEGR